MKRYKDWAPSGFDYPGKWCPEMKEHPTLSEWFVTRVHHRDSDSRTRREFRKREKILDERDPDGDSHIVLKFGHWAVGWVEVLLEDRKGKKEENP